MFRRLASRVGLVGTVACGGGTQPIALFPTLPGDSTTVAETAPAEVDWVAALVPVRPVRYVIRWRLQTPTRDVRGRADARLTPPDTLRFEYRAPFGRRGSALLVGGVIVRGEPEEEVRHLIEVVPLFWAALGVPWTPAGAAGGPVEGDRSTWRAAWGDTVLTYARRDGTPPALTALIEAGARPVGSSYAAFDPVTRQPTGGRLQIAAARAFLSFRIERVDTIPAAPPPSPPAPGSSG